MARRASGTNSYRGGQGFVASSRFAQRAEKTSSVRHFPAIGGCYTEASGARPFGALAAPSLVAARGLEPRT